MILHKSTRSSKTKKQKKEGKCPLPLSVSGTRQPLAYTHPQHSLTRGTTSKRFGENYFIRLSGILRLKKGHHKSQQ